MPLYQLMNNPITWLSVEEKNVKIFMELDKYRALAQTKAKKAA